MKKLVLALLLLLCLPVHAQYTPFALQIFQADVSGTPMPNGGSVHDHHRG